MSGFACQECGHKFRTVKAAERAAFGDAGCPSCGGSDIDLGSPTPAKAPDAEFDAWCAAVAAHAPPGPFPPGVKS